MADRIRARLLSAAIVLALVASVAVQAQDVSPPRLIDQPPFNVLTLDKANDSKVYKVHPVNLPGRRIPEKPKASEKLRVKLLENEEEYEIAWFNIAKLELYEQMVLAEIGKLTAEGKLDEAYDE